MKLLKNEQRKSNQNAKSGHICKEKYEHKHAKDKNVTKVAFK